MAVKETLHNPRGTKRPREVLLSEDTSAPNTQLVAEARSSAFLRRLVGVEVSCSASATITATTVIKRALEGGNVEIKQADIEISNDTSGAVYSNVYLLEGDSVEVTVPAAGGGITCSVMITEEFDWN